MNKKIIFSLYIFFRFCGNGTIDYSLKITKLETVNMIMVGCYSWVGGGHLGRGSESDSTMASVGAVRFYILSL